MHGTMNLKFGFLSPFSQLLEAELSFLVHMGCGIYILENYRSSYLLRNMWSANGRFVKRRKIEAWLHMRGEGRNLLKIRGWNKISTCSSYISRSFVSFSYNVQIPPKVSKTVHYTQERTLWQFWLVQLSRRAVQICNIRDHVSRFQTAVYYHILVV
jgi:hypothetical protein